MADLIIRGMEMPTNRDVTIRIDPNGEVYVYGTYPTLLLRAVPLPEKHGRLIDAGAFNDYMQNRYDNNEITNSDWIDFRLSLKDQPTIVPAEGEMGECSEN